MKIEINVFMTIISSNKGHTSLKCDFPLKRFSQTRMWNMWLKHRFFFPNAQSSKTTKLLAFKKFSDLVKQESDLIKQESDLVKRESDLA